MALTRFLRQGWRRHAVLRCGTALSKRSRDRAFARATRPGAFEVPSHVSVRQHVKCVGREP